MEQPLPQSQLPLQRLPLLKELGDQKVLQQNLGGDQLPPRVERQVAQRILLLLGPSNPRRWFRLLRVRRRATCGQCGG